MTEPRFFAIELDDAELQLRVSAAIDQAGHLGELLEIIGAGLERRIIERFTTKTDPNGAPWAPLSINTPAVYKAITGKTLGGSLLLRSGLMRSSAGHVVGPDYVEVGLGETYASYHEFGTRKIPRRGLVFGDPDAGTLGASDTAFVNEEIDRFLLDLL